MTSRERAELLSEGFGGWTASAIETVRMAIDAAVDEANKKRFPLDEAINEVVELAASYSSSIPGMREALQRVYDVEDKMGAK